MHSTLFHLRTSVVFSLLLALPAIVAKADEKAEPPVPVRTVAPDVPPSFARQGKPGLVTVSFTVDDKGNVQDEKVVKSTDSELEVPALTAIRKWRFKPAKKDGIAVAMHVAIPIKFQVD